MNTVRSYRLASTLALATAAFLLWAMGAVGIIGVEGDPADLMYLGVIAVGIAGAVVARFRADGMARAMWTTAAATVVVGVIALLLGKHRAEYSSVAEIGGLTAMFAGLFALAARLFQWGNGKHPA
jgi:hypothetical protein